jgi:hypothetical protein
VVCLPANIDVRRSRKPQVFWCERI